MTFTERALGHFHGDVQVCRACCPFDAVEGFGACHRPDAQWNYYAGDVTERHVGPLCGQCGRRVVQPLEITAPVVRVSNFLREGTGRLGDPPEVHSITITDVGGQYDWFCVLASCRIISEGLPNGDCHPSPEAAEQDAVRSHAEDGVPLDTRSLTRERMAPLGWDERPF